MTDTLPGYPLTNDPLLISVFGGIINALGISLCLFAEATSEGTDFIAIFMAERYNRDVWNFIFAGNVVILMTAGLLFGWDKALYSIIFQFTSTQVLSTVYKRYQKRTLFIITDQPEAVYKEIMENTHHGATPFAARAYMSKKRSHGVFRGIGGRNQARALTRARGGFPRLHQLPQDRFARGPLLPQAQRLAPPRGFCRFARHLPKNMAFARLAGFGDCQ